MKDYETGVFEQYHMEVNGTRKIRGAILCDTAEGWLLLKEAGVSEKRVPMLQQLYVHLNESGFPLVDSLVANEAGELLTVAEDGTRYVLKRWFHGRECDIRREYELLEAAKLLAHLHLSLRGVLEPEDFPETDLCNEYSRHNRELKKVRSFMRRKVGKGEFESAFLQSFDPMYEWAEHICTELLSSNYRKLYSENRAQRCMVHGDYNYHNILMTSNGIAVTNFEHFDMEIQTSDLYYFLRKSMEKHQWDEGLGDRILNAYGAFKPLSADDMEYMALRLAYPEKFWKIANSYYHSNKAWIPVKNLEKLRMSIRQTEEKKQFLQNIFAFHL